MQKKKVNKSGNAEVSKVKKIKLRFLKPPTYLYQRTNPTPEIYSPHVLTVKGWCIKNI